MTIRKVLVATLGHVDHGKTSLLDAIRKTVVAKGEAGGITQAIGVSIIPIETIQKICGKLMDSFQGKLSVPGLLTIDTPGHAAFTTLRKRGGSLADIAILVVDINDGLKPQTIESIEILKANKVPFVIAANKIDLIPQWKYDKSKFLLDNIAQIDYSLQATFEKKLYELVAQMNEHGFQAERFDRMSDFTQQIAIIPLSAHTGQGIPELLMILTGLAQRYLEKKLTMAETGPCKGTILEVKEEKGLGTTLDTIIYSGSLSVNDTLVIGGVEGPIITKVRALLEPSELSEMREKKSTFRHVKTVYAATGVKIVAPGLEKAVAGMPLFGTKGKGVEIDELTKDVQQEVSQIVVEETGESGVIIKADTLGGLEALRFLLHEKKIPISSSSLGNITKKDLSFVESMREKDLFYGIILGFNVNVPTELSNYIKTKELTIITHPVIYQIIDDYQKNIENLKKDIELKELSTLVRPCKFFILKGYIFRQNNPAIVGVEIEVGRIRTGDPIMNEFGKRITEVKSLKEGQESITIAQQGKQLAMAMDGVMVGRQIHEGDYLYTDISESHYLKFKELKKHLSKTELEVLKEIANIKRKDNPVWGVG